MKYRYMYPILVWSWNIMQFLELEVEIKWIYNNYHKWLYIFALIYISLRITNESTGAYFQYGPYYNNKKTVTCDKVQCIFKNLYINVLKIVIR